MKKRIFFILLITLLTCNVYAQESELELSVNDSAVIEKNLKEYENNLSKQDYNEASRYLNLVAYIYWQHNHNQPAVNFYSKSLELNNKIGNENGIAMINNNLGLLYSDIKNYTKSLEYFNKTLLYRKSQKQQKIGIVSTLLGISIVLDNLGRYLEAAEKIEEALLYSKEDNDVEKMRSCYGMLAEIYEKAGNKEKSAQNFDMYQQFNELIEKKSKEKYEIIKLQATVAENAKLKKEVELLNTEKELTEKEKKLKQTKGENILLLKNLSDAEIREEYLKQNATLNKLQAEQEIGKKEKTLLLVSLSTIFFIIITIILFFAYRNKKHINYKLAIKNNEILQQREEIIQQRDYLEEANGRIEKQNKDITSSITYASLIQTAMLNKNYSLNDLLKDSFIYFQPRDIVSGDFYWYAKVNDKIVVAAVDCTGHGVPGAFLSMIGNELLNKIVIFDKITSPEQILRKMDEGIALALNQAHTKNLDGMDLAICTIDLENRKMVFGGARNSMVLITNNELQYIKGSLFPIGGIFNQVDLKIFHEQEIDVSNESIFYMFSDGYADQLGGGVNQKYRIDRFRDLLLSVHKLPAEEQKEKIMKSHIEWRGKRKQLDDILIISAKI